MKNQRSKKTKLLFFMLLTAWMLNVLASTAQVSTVFCSDGSVKCNNGLTPVCSTTGYFPTCLPGFPSNIIECCKNNLISYYCKPELPVCLSVSSSSSSSSSSGTLSPNTGAYCVENLPYCANGTTVTCSDPTYKPKCLPGFPSSVIECCITNGISASCRPEMQFNCPIPGSSSSSKFQTVNIDVVKNPALHELVSPPLTTDAFKDRAGFALPGSSPSFEIKLPSANPNVTVLSVDLKDSSGLVFNNIPFVATPIAEQPEKFILQLTLPSSLKEGESRFALSFSDGSNLTGVLYISNAPQIAKLIKNSENIKYISRPIILRSSVVKSKNKLLINLKGRNFVGRKFLVQNGEEFNLVESTPDSPNTLVTIFPSSLKIKLLKTTVANSGMSLKSSFLLQQDILEKITAELVISTPAGLTSSEFTLNPSFKVPSNIAKPQVEGKAFCRSNKVVCTNGLTPYCTNSDYSTECLPGFPSKIPECCKDNDRSFNCNASLLKCK